MSELMKNEFISGARQDSKFISEQNRNPQVRLIKYKDTPLAAKSLKLTCEIIAFCRFIRYTCKEHELARQLLRCTSRVGANISEAQFAMHKTDFVYKMSAALKACSETDYWLVALHELGMTNESFDLIYSLNNECLKMLISSVKTSRQVKPATITSAEPRSSYQANRAQYTTSRTPYQ